jgi:crotonobetainyl-CoA:carnitine CoA-transferase CaiB-like acyl-CoA transferase
VQADTQPLAGILVVELAWYLPIAFAGSELVRLGARVVRIEPPGGDPLRMTAPAWDQALRAGKESVVCDLKTDVEFARALCGQGDVVLEGLRPGVAARLCIGADDLPPSLVYCSVTGFGPSGRHAQRAGHDLNYLGWAGVLEDTPTWPPVQIADLAAGGLGAATEVLAALVRRGRTGEGARLSISMTHGSHRLIRHRLDDEREARVLTGALACYRVYPTADGRHLTLGALEPKFFARACELIGRPDLAERQFAGGQDELARELEAAFARRPLVEWLELFDGEDVCVGPVATRTEAAVEFGSPAVHEDDAALGAHTAAWRAAVGAAG